MFGKEHFDIHPVHAKIKPTYLNGGYQLIGDQYRCRFFITAERPNENAKWNIIKANLVWNKRMIGGMGSQGLPGMG